MKSEKGQALALALVALTIGSIVVAPFLHSVSVHSLGSRVYSGSIAEQYASDAGVEDAIWRLVNDNVFKALLPAAGSSREYDLGELVNGITPITVAVRRDQWTLATENFESGGWVGGAGWVGAWQHSGTTTYTAVTTLGAPTHGGTYHLRLRGGIGDAQRAVDLSGQPGARLQFWAKAVSFEQPGDSARCLVSPDGITWTPVWMWTDGVAGPTTDDGRYRWYDIDLSSYTMSSSFWIRFEANMGDTSDVLYIDDIMVLRPFPGTTVWLPWDNFESAWWHGGVGWLGDWTRSAAGCSVTNQQPPIYQGAYHAQISGANSWIQRSANLTGQSGLHLQFGARIRSFEVSGGIPDSAVCEVSYDGGAWNPAWPAWTPADSDNTYHFINGISLSPCSQFRIRFSTGRYNSPNDYLYVDDVRIVKGGAASIAYEINSTAGDESTRADITVQGTSVSVMCWQGNRG